MLEDKRLIRKLKNGSSEALKQIYEKYKNDLLGLAIALSNNNMAAEDVVHDVFVSFAESAGRLRLRGSLKSYLSAAVANRVRNLSRANPKAVLGEKAENGNSVCNWPERSAMSKEEFQKVDIALAALPLEQREVIILHLQSGLKFKEIARSSGVSVNTIQSRYRYGLDKLRSILDCEVKK